MKTIMTMEEAHIKATLAYGEKYKNGVYVTIESYPGDDFVSTCQIISPCDWEGETIIGRGSSFEDAFEDAEFREKQRLSDIAAREARCLELEARIKFLKQVEKEAKAQKRNKK